MDTEIGAGFYFVADVDLRSRIVTGQHDGEARRAGQRRYAGAAVVENRVAHGNTVQNLSHALKVTYLCHVSGSCIGSFIGGGTFRELISRGGDLLGSTSPLVSGLAGRTAGPTLRVRILAGCEGHFFERIFFERIRRRIRYLLMRAFREIIEAP